MKLHKTLAAAAALSAIAAAAPSAQIRFAGVLGNSGESGETLVRTYVGDFPENGAPASGAGVVVDDSGMIWCRGANGAMLRLAPDGRLAATYEIPRYSGAPDVWDTTVRAGGLLVMRVKGVVAVLPLDAPAGSAATVIPGIRAERMSYSSTADGRVALYSQGMLSLFDPATGEITPAGSTGDMRVYSIEAGPGGEIYVVSAGGRLHRFVDGERSATDGWPRHSPGERPRILDGWWWGYAWHGTIRRSDMLLNPSPGVVLGGNSGSFIGHLDENPDINNTSGLALLKPRIYVGVGEHGVAQTLEWDPAEACLKIRRRLGALDSCPGLAIDAKGRIFCGSGNWEWSDTPVSPIRHGVPPVIAGQPCVIGSESVLAPCWVYSTRPSVFVGTMDKELASHGLSGAAAFSKKVAALAVWREKKQNWMVVAESDGTAHASRLGGDNRPANNGAIQMELAFDGPVGRITSLAVKPAANESECDSLLAAVDGTVVELARTETGFRETRRWNSWGGAPEDRFGETIYIHAHSGRLWASDAARARVLAFDLAAPGPAPLAQFGATDSPGSAVNALDRPGHIAAFADRAVVYDAANQRLVKLEFRR